MTTDEQLKQAGKVAQEILDRRDPFGSEPLDHTFIRLLLAEAYSIGVRDDQSPPRPLPPMTVRGIAEAIADEFTGDFAGGDANVDHQAMVSYVRLTTPDGSGFKITIEEAA